jgi:hypothetical protein
MTNRERTTEQLITEKHTELLRQGFHLWPELKEGKPPAMGDYRWTADLILSTWLQAETGMPPTNGLEYRVGNSAGGFDVLDFKFPPRIDGFRAMWQLISPSLSIADPMIATS